MEARRIAIFLAQVSGVQERVRLGIYRFARPFRPWDFLNLNLNDYPAARLWKPHGAIGRAGRADFSQAARALGIPFVNLYGGAPMAGLPQVGTSNEAIGQMAADYLLGLGFSKFGCVGMPNDPASEDRRRSFSTAIEAAGKAVYPMTPGARYPRIRFDGVMTMKEESTLHRYLAWIPKPAAVFAIDDRHALLVSESCRHLRLRIPDDIAILGVGNDELLCFESYPPISSVRIPLESEGYRAAELLEVLMAGKRPPAKPVLLLPEGIAARQSTDILCVGDARMAAALRYIRTHASEPLDVGSVARACGVNRRQMERQFRITLGRSPLQEIRRTQLEAVKNCLRDSDLTIDAIASRTGFSSRSRLSVEFHKKVGLTPAAFRQQFRLR